MSVKAFDHSGKEVFTTVDLTAKMSTLELVEMWENEKKLGFFWDTK